MATDRARVPQVSTLRPGIAIDALLAGLIDYAGLYPPASLDMRSAVENYSAYRRGPHAGALGRFIVDFARLDELRATAPTMQDLKFSVLLSQPPQPNAISTMIDSGLPIEAVEARAASPGEVEQITRNLPPGVEVLIEIPVDHPQPNLLRAISDQGARAKLRMGGVTVEAFPSPPA